MEERWNCSGTVMVKNLVPGFTSTSGKHGWDGPKDLTAFENTLFFFVDDAAYGHGSTEMNCGKAMEQMLER